MEGTCSNHKVILAPETGNKSGNGQKGLHLHGPVQFVLLISNEIHHFPLLLQSFGCQWSALASIRTFRFDF